MVQENEPLTRPVATMPVRAGGRSTRLVVVGMGAVIAALFSVAVTGRSGPPTTREQASVVIPTALGRDKFAVTAVIADRRFMGLLEERSPGELSGTYRLPVAKPDSVARFELTQLWSIEGENYVPISRWEVPLDRVSGPAPKPSVLLDVAVNGNPDRSHAPRPVRLGYSLVISAERTKTVEFVTFELRMPTR